MVGKNTIDWSSTRREEREARFLGCSVHELSAGLASMEPSDGSVSVGRPGANTPVVLFTPLFKKRRRSLASQIDKLS